MVWMQRMITFLFFAKFSKYFCEVYSFIFIFLINQLINYFFTLKIASNIDANVNSPFVVSDKTAFDFVLIYSFDTLRSYDVNIIWKSTHLFSVAEGFYFIHFVCRKRESKKRANDEMSSRQVQKAFQATLSVHQYKNNLIILPERHYRYSIFASPLWPTKYISICIEHTSHIHTYNHHNNNNNNNNRMLSLCV